MFCGFNIYTMSKTIAILIGLQDYFLWRQEDAHRNALNANYELPLGGEYAKYVISFLHQD